MTWRRGLVLLLLVAAPALALVGDSNIQVQNGVVSLPTLGTDGIPTVAGGVLQNAAWPRFSVSWPAASLEVDGSICQTASSYIAGRYKTTVQCADNSAGILNWDVNLPDRFSGSSVSIEFQAIHVGATINSSNDNLAFDVRCQCRGDGDTLNASWSTPLAVAFGFTTQHVEEHESIPVVTPNGACQGGDTLYCEASVNATLTDSLTSEMHLLGVKTAAPTGQLGD